MFSHSFQRDMEGAVLNSSNSLLCLPLHLIEKIIRLLLNQRKYQNTGIVEIDFTNCLTDVLNLRATCTYLLEIVNNTRLKLPYVFRESHINSHWLESDLNDGLNSFLDFMKTKTNWKISSLSVECDVFQNEQKIQSILIENEFLFASYVKKLELYVETSVSSTIVTKLLSYFRKPSLESN